KRRKVPLLDEAGAPVRDGGALGLSAGSGEPVMVEVPVMVRVNRPRQVARPVLDTDGEPVIRLGVRYGDLAMLMLACARRRALRLERRVA
ncbi:hypothetical protein, partial [Enterobacter hormaechei]